MLECLVHEDEHHTGALAYYSLGAQRSAAQRRTHVRAPEKT